MFQKLKQKLKNNKLIQKILSLFTIFVVLCSMLVIPSSANDEVETNTPEVEDTIVSPDDAEPNVSTHVDPITDVFTGVTSWVMSALSTVTGVFYGSSGDVIYEFYVDYLIDPEPPTLNGVEYGCLVNNFPYLPVGTNFEFSILGSSASLVVEDLQGHSWFDYSGFYFAYFEDGPLGEGWYCSCDFDSSIRGEYGSLIVPSTSSLTFLGTLAVVGLGLTIIFLFIGVITNFLKNRG